MPNLYDRSIPVNDKISIQVPLLRDVLKDEDTYYATIQALTSTPYEMMLWLEDTKHVNFTSVDRYDLFCMMFADLQGMDTRLVFGDLDLRNFSPTVARYGDTYEIEFLNSKDGCKIDRMIYESIRNILCDVHHIKPEEKKAANNAARKYLLDKARRKAKRAVNKKRKSQLEMLIVAVVNTSECSYDYNSILDLTIYQFEQSVSQIIRKINTDNIMRGIYAGTVDAKNIPQEELSWIPV